MSNNHTIIDLMREKAALVDALKDIRTRARSELDDYTGWPSTTFYLIEKVAIEALKKAGESDV